MDLTVTILDAHVARVAAALCAADGNPDVSAQHARQAVINWIKQTVVNVEQSAAIQAPPVITPPTVT